MEITDNPDKRHVSDLVSSRYPSDGGWYFHVASTISEWIVATVFCFYILSFSEEFRDVHLDHPSIRLVSLQEPSDI